MNKKSDASQLREGDFLSEIQYYKVLQVNSTGVLVVNEREMEFTISRGIIEEGSFCAGQYAEEQLVTRTELVTILANAGETVFTANFNKKLDVSGLKEAFNDPAVQVKSKAAMERMLLGEERTIVGYLKSSDAMSGRFQVVDLEDEKKLVKQVDQRTLNWVILRNVKYIVK